MKSNIYHIEIKNMVRDRNDGAIICDKCKTEMVPSDFIINLDPQIRIYQCSRCSSFKDVIND